MVSPVKGKAAWTLPNGEVVLFPRGMRQERALEVVRPGRALLDVGCGRAAVAAALSARFEEVCGVDTDEEMLEDAARRGVATRRVDLDTESLPYDAGAFDAVLCLEVIEHVRDPEALARELARVLQPRGALYLSTPNIRFASYLRRLIVEGRFPVTSDDPIGFQGGHIHFFTYADVAELLRGAGFDEVKHDSLAAGRAERISRVLPVSLAREFLSVGIFTVARRGEGPVPPPRAAVRVRRSA
jgi:methionine biosynthesis protein MetW